MSRSWDLGSDLSENLSVSLSGFFSPGQDPNYVYNADQYDTLLQDNGVAANDIGTVTPVIWAALGYANADAFWNDMYVNGILKQDIIDVIPSGQVFFIDEDMEGTGAPSGWAVTGSALNWDETSFGAAPMSGTKSLRLPDSGTPNYADYTFLAGPNRYAKFIFTGGGLNFIDNKPFFQFLDASGDILSTAQVDDSQIEIIHGATQFDSTDSPLVNDTPMYIWFEHESGSGANGVLRLYHNTTDLKPGSPNYTITTGTATADVAKARIGSTALNVRDMLWDNIQVSDQPIS